MCKCGVRSFAGASTLGHALGRGRLYHLLVSADQFGQVVGDSDVEPRDGTPAEVRASRRQLLKLVERVQPEEVPVCLRVGKVIPGIYTKFYGKFFGKIIGNRVYFENGPSSNITHTLK